MNVKKMLEHEYKVDTIINNMNCECTQQIRSMVSLMVRDNRYDVTTILINNKEK